MTRSTGFRVGCLRKPSTPTLSAAAPTSTTTVGTSGYIAGGQSTAIELQYVGNNQFLQLSFAGVITFN